MKLITVKLSEVLVEGMDELIKTSMYSSRGDVVRAAVRELLRSELWQQRSS